MAPLIWLMSMILHVTSGVNLQQAHGAAETCQAIENQLFWALESCPAFNGEDCLQTAPAHIHGQIADNRLLGSCRTGAANSA